MSDTAKKPTYDYPHEVIDQLQAQLGTEREKSAGLEARVVGLETILASTRHERSCPADECVAVWEKLPEDAPPTRLAEVTLVNKGLACNCFKSLDPLKVGRAVLAVIAAWKELQGFALDSGMKGREDTRLIPLRVALDALVSAGTEGQ